MLDVHHHAPPGRFEAPAAPTPRDQRAGAWLVAAVVMDGWLHDVFELPETGVRVDFSPGPGEYTFHWGGVEPFSDVY